MSIPEFVSLLRRRIWLIVGITAGLVVAVAVWSLMTPATYKATAKMSILVNQPAEGTGSLDPVNSDLLDSYTEIAESRTVREQIADELDLAGPGAVNLTVTHPPKSVLLEIVVHDEDPDEAALIANLAARRISTILKSTAPLTTAPGEETTTSEEGGETTADEETGTSGAAASDESTSEEPADESSTDETATDAASSDELVPADGEAGEASQLSVKIFEKAVPPSSPASPQVVRNILLALVFGLAAGIAAAIIREIFDTRLRDPAAVSELLDLPVLATIATDKQLREHAMLLDQDDLDQEEIAQDRLLEMWSRSRIAEEFRQLRANLQFFDFEHRPRSIMVTSSKPGEGKTTTAGNLAITMALAGESVVVVDCDLRRPSIAKSLHVHSEIGLTDVLIGRASLDSAVVSGRRLAVLPAGAMPPNPSELLGSQAMADLLTELHTRYSVVVIDTPPTLPFADPAVLAPLCGATLMVVRMNYTNVAELERATAALRGVQARLSGAVVNMLDRRAGGRGYGGYYYYSYAYRRPGESADMATTGHGMVRPRASNGRHAGNGGAPPEVPVPTPKRIPRAKPKPTGDPEGPSQPSRRRTS